MRRLFRGRLWTHADFLKLWSGETVSEFGSEVTALALPTVAILTLHATPFQVGIVPTILIGAAISTLAAVWVGVGPVSRLREQPVPV